MLLGLYIVVQDDFTDPLYAEPESEELDDPATWVAACEALDEAIEGDGDASGVKAVGEAWVGWKLARNGVGFIAIVSDDVRKGHVTRYLDQIARQYADEVDDPLDPEREGVADIMVDVIPPWEEDEV